MSDNLPALEDDWRPDLDVVIDRPRQGLIGRMLRHADVKGLASDFEREAAQRGLRALDPSVISHIAERHHVSGGAINDALRDVVLRWITTLRAGSYPVARRAIAACAERLKLSATILDDLEKRGAGLLAEALAQLPDDQVSFAAAKAAGSSLGLSPVSIKTAYDTRAQARLSAALRAALVDGEFSPPDEEAIKALAKRLEVRPAFTAAEAEDIRDGAMAWTIRNAELPTISAPVNLQKGEVAYRVVPATAWQDATRSRSLGYSGVTTSVRLMRGVYYRVGSIKSHRVTEHYEKSIGAGQLIATNKRLIFFSGEKPSAVTLKSILQIEPYNDALIVVRTTGKPTTYRFDGEDKWFGAVLARAIVEANQ